MVSSWATEVGDHYMDLDMASAKSFSWLCRKLLWWECCGLPLRCTLRRSWLNFTVGEQQIKIESEASRPSSLQHLDSKNIVFLCRSATIWGGIQKWHQLARRAFHRWYSTVEIGVCLWTAVLCLLFESCDEIHSPDNSIINLLFSSLPLFRFTRNSGDPENTSKCLDSYFASPSKMFQKVR